MSYGVIIGRFQTSSLHDGHKYIIDYVYKDHENVVIMVGVHNSMPTKRNPLDFWSRYSMIQQVYPKATIVPIKDHFSDEEWSKSIDATLDKICNGKDCTLYGGRDSFIKYYSGKHKTAELQQKVDISSTELRKLDASTTSSSELFRKGMIYSVHNRYAHSYIAVDIAMFNDKQQVLFGKKEGEPHYRFIGGFVDPSDENITRAAKRELLEECGGNFEADDFRIIGETRIDDWRYKHDDDKIFTILFACKFIYGQITPSDDIHELKWIDIKDIPYLEIMPAHKELKKILVDHLNQKS